MGILVVNSDPAALWGKVYIQFADPAVKAICVDNWGSDGEITDEQAAAVTDLGDAFKGNADITSYDELRYFTGLTSIGKQAFYGCTSLTSLTVPEGVTTIAGSAFYECSALTSVTLPESVTLIAINSFYGCSSLTSLTVRATTPPSLDRSAISAIPQGFTIYVPAASVDAYKAANVWSNYASMIQAITE